MALGEAQLDGTAEEEELMEDEFERGAIGAAPPVEAQWEAMASDEPGESSSSMGLQASYR